MWILSLLRCVRDGLPLNHDSLRAFVQGVAMGSVADYQAAAFLMAVYQRGLSDEDTAALTLAMRDSGPRINLNAVPGLKVDKHSTGGVGDKLSLPLAPWVAACGVPVPMVAGRGLGHTGGTLDKLESIHNFKVNLTSAAFTRNVTELGTCIMGQTADLAPADGVFYALRDVTATVESTPLITASILAKKLAEGIDALVLDVKMGSGAFMKDLPSATRLAESIIRVGNKAGLRVRALITDMDAPLGRTIGNALEVKEAIDILHGRGPHDATNLTRCLAAHMLILGGRAADEAQANRLLDHALQEGHAWQKFRQMVIAQGGDVAVIDDPDRLPRAQFQTVLTAPKQGFVARLDAYGLGHGAMLLGAGRSSKTDAVDVAVGVQLHVELGQALEPLQPWLTVHHNAPLDAAAQAALEAALELAFEAPPARPQVLAVLGD